MAEITKYDFSHKELVEALIKQQGIHDGIWSLTVEFGLAVANTGPGPNEIHPTALVPLVKTGIMKTNEMTSLAVDASVVNPAQPKKSSAKAK
jgi:uncharacterized membrane protein